MGLKTYLFFLCLVFFHSPSSAQQYQRYLVDTLCSPSFDGRGYVNQGAEKAADFIRHQFDSLALKPIAHSYFQEFDMKVNTFPGKMNLSIAGNELIPGQDYMVSPLSGSGKGSDFQLKEISIYKPKQLDKLLKNIDKLKQTVLLIRLPDSLSANGNSLTMQTVYLLCEQWPIMLLSDKKLSWSVSDMNLANPLFILNDPTLSAKAKVSFEVDAKKINVAQRNVIAIKKSTNPHAKYLVISAHYDHLGRMGQATYFPGANDNASGVAELLALAALIDSIQFDHHIVFIAFAGEEAGLIGSQYFVEHPLFPLDSIDFLLNLDISGTGDEGITVVNASKFPDEYALLVSINSSENAVADIASRGPAANSDHYPFYEKGVPSFFIYTRGGIKAYHDIYDRAETLPLTKAEDLLSLYSAFLLALDAAD
jgi:hypothetical protein